MNETALVQKVWNYAHVLRDQGVPYQAYISQISYLLFLKMDDERAGLVASGLIRGEGSAIPQDCRWPVLRDLQGEELTRRYSAILDQLSRRSGIVGTIFLKAQNEIQDPAKLRRVVGLIDGETWLGLGVDVKGSIYEGLLERNAQEVKSGAGQYFTPRALIDAMVIVIDPEPRERSTTRPAAPAAFCSPPGSICASSRWRAMPKSIRRCGSTSRASTSFPRSCGSAR